MFNPDGLFQGEKYIVICFDTPFYIEPKPVLRAPTKWIKIPSIRKAVIKASEETRQWTPGLHFSTNLADWMIGACRVCSHIASGMLNLKSLGWCNLCWAQVLEEVHQKVCDLHEFWSVCWVLCPTGLQEWGNILWNVLHAGPFILEVRAKIQY